MRAMYEGVPACLEIPHARLQVEIEPASPKAFLANVTFSPPGNPIHTSRFHTEPKFGCKWSLIWLVLVSFTSY
jgi:hypothetical protein